MNKNKSKNNPPEHVTIPEQDDTPRRWPCTCTGFMAISEWKFVPPNSFQCQDCGYTKEMDE